MDNNRNRFDHLSRPSTSRTSFSDTNTRMSGISKLDSSLYRRKISSNNSYTDYAYREAMNRLKHLLSEPYTPSAQLTTIYQRPIYESASSFAASDSHNHDHHTFPGRPSLKELTKYFPGTNIVRATCYTAPNHSTDKPIIHEIPSGSCSQPSLSHHAPISSRDTDSNNHELLRFIERQENYIKTIERESDTNREELSSLKFKVQELMHENDNLHRMDSDSERDFGKSSTVVMLETKVADLEAKLSQEKLDVKRLKEENDSLRSKIASGAGLEIVETYKRKCDDMMREKQRLQDDVKRLEHKLDHVRTYETNSYSSKTFRDRDYGIEKTFDKSQLEIEVRRLKEDLEYQKERYESLQQEMNRRVAEEREAALRGCTHHKYDHISSSDDIGAKWEYASKLQFEIDRHKRVEADLKRELSQKNLYVDDLKAEYRHKIKAFQSELNELNAIRDTLESENNHLKLQLERTERQTQVEGTRLNNETASLRQRLDRADSDLMHARREQLRLNEQISALEKELAISDATRDTSQRPELSRIISDMEHKHASTVNELEGMITSQKELMEKLTAECKTLTHKLEDTTLKHKEDISSLQTNLQTLSNKLTTNPSITSAPSSLLAQSNILSSLNLTSNNNVNQDKSKVDNLYDSIISTTVDNMSSLSHSLTNQLSAIKDTYSLPMFSSSNLISSNINNEISSGQDLVKEPSITEASRSLVEQSPRKQKAPFRRMDSQSAMRASPVREPLQRFKSTESIQSATGFEKPYSKQEEYGGLEKRDSNDVALEESTATKARRGSKSRLYESPSRKINVDIVSKTYEMGGQQQEEQPYGSQYGYEKAEDEYNREKFEERRFSPDKPPLPPGAMPRYEVQQQPQQQYYASQPQQEQVQEYVQEAVHQQPQYVQGQQYEGQRGYEYEQQQQQQYAPQGPQQGYVQEVPQSTGYQIEPQQQQQNNYQEQYQMPSEVRYEVAQEQQYRPEYVGEQQQPQYQQYREPEYVSSQPQADHHQQQQQQIFNAPEYEQQIQYQQSAPEVVQYQPQQNIPQSPRTYAQQNVSAMPAPVAQGQYQEFVDASGYAESRQGRDAEGIVYAPPTGGIRDSPTLDRARQSPTGVRQQSPIGGGSPVIVKQLASPQKQQQEMPVAEPKPAKKSPSPPVATTEVVPPVTQINQTIRKEVSAPSTTSTARRGTRPPTLRSVTARTRAAATGARGGNR